MQGALKSQGPLDPTKGRGLPTINQGGIGGSVSPPCSSGSECFCRVVRIEEGLALEDGAGDGEEPVGDRAQCPAVGVATGPQRGVSVTARGIVLDGDPGPVVEGAAQAHVAGLAYDDDAALAASAGHGGDTVDSKLI